MRLVTLALGLAALAAACGGNAPPSSPEPTATTSPAVRQVAEAVRLADVNALLGLIDWQPTACGSPRGATDPCPEGVSAGTELPMINAGFGDTFQVRAETLGPALQQVLQGELLRMTFLATSDVSEHRGRPIDGPVYFLGMEGMSRPVSPTNFWGDATQQTGVFLELNAGSATPILEIGFLSETWTAAQQAGGLQFSPGDVVALYDNGTPTVVAPATALAWRDASRDVQIVVSQTGTCGDAATASAYDVPARLEVRGQTGLRTSGPYRLGLEAEPYEYVQAQVINYGDWDLVPPGWELTQREVLNGLAAPNRFGIQELFLRRLGEPTLLFRYYAQACETDGTPAPTTEQPSKDVVRLPVDLPHVVVHRQGDYISAEEAIKLASKDQPNNLRPVWLELGTPAEIDEAHGGQDVFALSGYGEQVVWAVVFDAGDYWGPKRPGHANGMSIIVSAATDSANVLQGTCCLDLVTGR